MAQKEALVVILDVSKRTKEIDSNNSKTFFEKQKECCIQILQKKIFADKKDEVAFVLIGTENTDNELNRTLGGYDNIVEGISMEIPNWKMLTSLVKSIDLENGSSTVDWMDSLVIALDILRKEDETVQILKNCFVSSILYSVDDTSTEEVIQRLKDVKVELVIINDNIKYKDDLETKVPKAFFPSSISKSANQIISEKLAMKIIQETESILCNFDIAISRIMQGVIPKGRPWFWYSTLDIGSKIKISIGVTISIKPEAAFKFKTKSVDPNSVCWLATEYFENGEKIMSSSRGNEMDEDNEEQKAKFSTEDLINAYMLGTTPIPYENSAPDTKQCMQCISFTHRSNVLPQYFVGTGTYLVFARPTMSASEKMMAALVEALVQNDLVMIGRRVFRDGLRPKFIALFPNKEQEYPCLTLFELICAEQQVNWYFPNLKSKKNEPTEEQYNAIEDLINSMNLDTDLNLKSEIRDKYEKDLLPLNSLPNVTNEYICQVATERIIKEANDVTLSVKGRDNIFNVPEILNKRSEEPLKKIKELFPLKEVKKEIKKELIRHVGNIDSWEMNDDIVIETKPLEYKELISVGTVTPAEDYKALIKQEIEEVSFDKQEEKVVLFDKLAKQIQEVLKDLIFKTMSIQYEKIVKAIKTYRDEAVFYNPYDYNDFIREIKYMISCRKMYEFWEEVIVKNRLGLLSSKESIIIKEKDDEKDIEEFYQINIEKGMVTDDNDAENVDDLFDDM